MVWVQWITGPINPVGELGLAPLIWSDGLKGPAGLVGRLQWWPPFHSPAVCRPPPASPSVVDTLFEKSVFKYIYALPHLCSSAGIHL